MALMMSYIVADGSDFELLGQVIIVQAGAAHQNGNP
jgi:hypothetical protein